MCAISPEYLSPAAKRKGPDHILTNSCDVNDGRRVTASVSVEAFMSISDIYLTTNASHVFAIINGIISHFYNTPHTCLFSCGSILAVGPTKPPWIPGALSPGQKRPGLESNHSSM